MGVGPAPARPGADDHRPATVWPGPVHGDLLAKHGAAARL